MTRQVTDVRPRFWEKVKKGSDDECWEWIASTSPGHGYGVIGIGDKVTVCSHVLSYMLHYGLVPEGKEVCHTCNNRKCVNPKHLYAGTRKENVLQAWREGRMNQIKTASQIRWARVKYGAIIKSKSRPNG